MSPFETYMKEINPLNMEQEKDTEEWRINFLSDFPRDRIESLSRDEFLYAKKGYGNEKSFCCRLWNNRLASLGNSRPGIFGIYYSNGTELTLSKTFQNICDDYDSAFRLIKKEIVSVLSAGERGDLEAIENCKLNSSFKCLLLATYFKYTYIPAPTTTALDAYCEAVGLSFDSKENPIYRNVAIVQWMHDVPEMEHWTTYHLMLFGDWLWKEHLKIDGTAFKRNIDAVKAKKLTEEISMLNLRGESRKAVVKVRVNQGVFRDLLLRRYDHCCLCGVKNPSLLIASHIKPWAESKDEEKLDVNNGFLMCPNHDRLFDQGLITFEDDGRISISSELSEPDMIFTNVTQYMKISLTEGNRHFLEYHRKYIFVDNQ